MGLIRLGNALHETYYLTGKLNAAAYIYEQLHARNESDVESMIGYAKALLASGNSEAATKILNR